MRERERERENIVSATGQSFVARRAGLRCHSPSSCRCVDMEQQTTTARNRGEDRRVCVCVCAIESGDGTDEDDERVTTPCMPHVDSSSAGVHSALHRSVSYAHQRYRRILDTTKPTSRPMDGSQTAPTMHVHKYEQIDGHEKRTEMRT